MEREQAATVSGRGDKSLPGHPVGWPAKATRNVSPSHGEGRDEGGRSIIMLSPPTGVGEIDKPSPLVAGGWLLL